MTELIKTPFSLSFPLALILVSFLSGCGTTSSLERSSASDLLLNSKRFEAVLVKDVVTENAKTDATPQRVALAGEELQQMIVSQIRNTEAFNSVAAEGEVDVDTLVLDTKITRYEDGNAVARLMIGFGAGSSRFDASFKATDGETGKSIGSILADKNSWVLGGGLAAGQDADSYMPGIAKKVAEQLAPLGVNYKGE
ncbi:MAG: DUF4410 domain-containing protein [Verrucomicrobiota bacterium]